jgi:FkbM family methyltransferase
MNFNFIKKALIVTLNNSIFCGLLEYVFSVLSRVKNGKGYQIIFDKENKFWIHKREDLVIAIDDKPNYSISEIRNIESSIQYYFKYYKINPDDVIIDVGAGIGNDVFAIKRYFDVPFQLYAFEAHPTTFSMLKNMVKMNNFHNVKLFQYAICEVSKLITINTTTNHSANRIIDTDEGFKVEGITLDEFVSKNNITKINYIKFNIEGAEREALMGMKKGLEITENIVVACHDKLAQYYNNDPHFITLDFVKETLIYNDFEITEIEESLYHITIYAKKININE